MAKTGKPAPKPSPKPAAKPTPKTDPGWPSKTPNPSGPGRKNAPPKK